MQFENICHYNILKAIIELSQTNKSHPIYGIENGLDSFISIGYQLDGSVFLFETIKLLNFLAGETLEEFVKQPYYSDLKSIRNNIHTYFKNGGYAKKADNIIDEKQKDYKLDRDDFFYLLRNDISLVFQIKNQCRYLLGADYFVFHCIFESEQRKKWEGVDFRDYAEFLSANISSIFRTIDETPYKLTQLSLNNTLPNVELFDYKSHDLLNGCKVSQPIAFRLMLIQYQISYILLFVEEVLNYKSIQNDDLWTMFFYKLIAIKYDESFDNLQSILKYSSDTDKRYIKKLCEKNNILLENLKARKYAQKLRNTLHYQRIDIDIAKIHNKSTRDIITAIYLSNSYSNSISEFREKGQEMIFELKSLQNIIRDIFSVDKKFYY